MILVLATGRMFRSALPYAEALGSQAPLICYQGAVVRGTDGEPLREWPVSSEAAEAAVRFSREHDLHVNLYRDDQFFIEKDGWGARRYAEVAQLEPVKVPDLMDLARDGSTKVVFVDQPERLRQVDAAIAAAMAPGGARTTFSMPEFLEAVDRRVSKGTALAFVCERLGVSPEEVIAAGDAPNDVEMLEWAGLAVAPRNAHPDVLAVADVVVAPPGEDGIAELVERYLD